MIKDPVHCESIIGYYVEWLKISIYTLGGSIPKKKDQSLFQTTIRICYLVKDDNNMKRRNPITVTTRPAAVDSFLVSVSLLTSKKYFVGLDKNELLFK